MSEEDFDDLYGGKYLAALDIKKPINTVIEAVTIEAMGDGKKKAVLWTRATKKGIVVNKTNAGNLPSAYGKDPDGWADQRITVKAEPTNFGGRPTKGIRIYPAETPAVKAPPKNTSNDFNDSIDM